MTTNLMSPQLQIYNKVFKASLSLGHDTYDYLPANNTKLPFVYIGEQFDQDIANKTSITGNVQQSIHVYGGHKQRREVTTIMNNLKTELRRIRKTESFNVTVRNINSQIMIDNSTSTTLLHGIVEVEFTFN